MSELNLFAKFNKARCEMDVRDSIDCKISVYAPLLMRNVTQLTLVLGFLIALIAGTAHSRAWAQSGAVQDGQAIANAGTIAGVPACASCHGSAGEGEPDAGIPRLAGIDDGYIERELEAFRSGTRISPVMSQYAKALTAEQVSDVSAYYASLPAPMNSSPAATSPLDQGQNIALAGNIANGVPSCASCHGGQGAGYNGAPALAGQSYAYIAEQLSAWQQGARAEGPDFFMPLVAARLSTAEIAAVSAYYASLPSPAATQAPTPPLVTSGDKLKQ